MLNIQFNGSYSAHPIFYCSILVLVLTLINSNNNNNNNNNNNTDNNNNNLNLWLVLFGVSNFETNFLFR